MLENQGVGASFVLVHINIECILFIDNIKEAFRGFFPHWVLLVFLPIDVDSLPNFEAQQTKMKHNKL